jgi:hypothetical protein
MPAAMVTTTADAASVTLDGCMDEAGDACVESNGAVTGCSQTSTLQLDCVLVRDTARIADMAGI